LNAFRLKGHRRLLPLGDVLHPPASEARQPNPRGIAPLLAALSFLFLVPSAVAGPLAYPGDIRLRHQLQLLKDTGGTDALTSTWPVTLPDVAQDLGRGAPNRRISLPQNGRGWISPRISLAVADEPILLRSFQDTPRGRGEAEVRAGWQNRHFALRIQGQAVRDPVDDKEFRLDGSYGGLLLGNWIVSAGAVPRWWGPGWSGSLILSNNARPVPAVAVDRKLTDAFDLPVLRWLGEWRISAFLGQLESGRAVSEAKLFGVRAVVQPVGNLEIGLFRVAQWGGQGRPEDGEAFADMLLGRDNQGDNAASREPGNQLAGFDFRLASPFVAFPLAVYGQAAGEDEAGGLPYKWMGLAGVEGWGTLPGPAGTFRLYAEVAETSLYDPDASGGTAFNTAYEHHIYRTGYRYRGRSLGYAADNDTTLASLGGVVALADGMTWHGVLRWGRINRDGGGTHPLFPEGAELRGGFLSGTLPTAYGALEAGVEVNRLDPRSATEGAETNSNVYVRWSWPGSGRS
jgi:hypothetical protein